MAVVTTKLESVSWRLKSPETREWAFALNRIDPKTGKNAIIRHLHFNSYDDVNEALDLLHPIHVWHSTARYDRPSASDMTMKGWQGADIAIDIDTTKKDGSPALNGDPALLDDSNNSLALHAALNLAFSSSRVSALTSSEKTRLLQSAELHALGAAWALREALGARDIHYTFSGSRGIHVYATDDKLVGLSREMRQEIADLLVGTSVRVKKLMGSGYVEMKRGYGVQMDSPITTDTHRVIRVPGTRHGKTGRICEPLDESSLVRNLRSLIGV